MDENNITVEVLVCKGRGVERLRCIDPSADGERGVEMLLCRTCLLARYQ